MKPNIGIADSNREGVCRLLNALLADEYLLYTKTRKYHWNVVGMDFAQLHAFFETQYTQLEEFIDDIAERVRQLGGMALGTLAEFLQQGRLKEHPGQNPPPREMVASLLADHEALIRQLRNDQAACADKYQDIGTNDFLVGLMEEHEKMAWMLRAHVEETAG